MNHHQQEHLRAKLVKAGLWNDVTAHNNPARNWIALEELCEIAQKRLANSACLFVFRLNGGRQGYQVILSFKEDEDLILGLGNDIYEAICTAVLTLPILFAEHPEYSANGLIRSKSTYGIGVIAGDQSTPNRGWESQSNELLSIQVGDHAQ
jgi:hypothetical protein